MLTPIVFFLFVNNYAAWFWTGSKPVLDISEEKAIVLYKVAECEYHHYIMQIWKFFDLISLDILQPGAHPPEANGSTTHEGNSKYILSLS